MLEAVNKQHMLYIIARCYQLCSKMVLLVENRSVYQQRGTLTCQLICAFEKKEQHNPWYIYINWALT